ncbi:hypothetical protein CIB95_07180 [Lottiidibacillus patelloidae]|uniref:CAAX prenyl protease 2/Lysostaphin resistance protein A-like domain-containing protein n=1 Tax=Lottiidibacillus patelloidae TaxID=2670334 RepID=A0A263BU36_9BACI|nr:type II CAAX endopeptidase family protein [Lottiidibacillus patelloidae]OZM57239.1 hypothetical protein CIB95_07180 [Lottiidibacillus patelloidae]
MMNQKELIKRLSDKELLLNVYATQVLVFIIGFILYYFLFDDLFAITDYLNFNVNQILIYSIPTAALVIIIDIIISKQVPKQLIDDGGINQRIFQHLSLSNIILLSATVSIVEEFVFRGVLQVKFGLVLASIIFALLHFRYLKKVVMLTLVVAISFLLGLLFYWTNNLLVTIVTHFLIDVTLGIFVRYKLINL